MKTEEHLHLLIGQLLVQIAMLRAELDAAREREQAQNGRVEPARAS